ncbi:MAG: asparagine synthase (glutamine-hydrolyzing) [Capsulimonadales bacterium]|nr:asparagine synthase (glutamine-hydrolyzing) [Capsulimonadales bacterium]
MRNSTSPSFPVAPEFPPDMCGLAGFLDPSDRRSVEERTTIIERMAGVLAHRGPDDSGLWQDVRAGVALGFRRLAIRDLSPAGHQPMRSASGRFVLVFNGEVYNSEEIRAELAATGRSPSWRGTSDTETMLAAIETWGLSAAVGRFVGMFALAVRDNERRTLSLVRDRLGIKPLYYGSAGRAIVFGSELKALCAHPDFLPEIDPVALTRFLRYAYVPTPLSIYRNAAKLPPGTILTFTENDTAFSPRPVPYWSLTETVNTALREPFTGSEEEATDAFLERARQAVRLRLIADVPLGAFLSGGLDSSLVVALMQEASSRPVRTFCIGFTEEAYNEADQARAVAAALGTDHTERLATPEEAMSVIPRLPAMYDEPFADPSQIPTFLVSELARRQVTVSLSGDGGDELLAGYNAYTHGEEIRQIARRLGVFRGAAAGAIKTFPPQFYRHVLRGRYTGDRLHKLADLLTQDPLVHHRQLMSHWKSPSALTGVPEPEEAWLLPEVVPPPHRSWTPIEEAMFRDTLTYLPDDILTKVDRASMAVSLEARVPLLDHRLVAFCWSLPMSYKRRDGRTKRVLRRALERYLPRELFDRPKRGFGVPIDDWLRGPLRPWAEELLSEAALREDGWLDPKPIRAAWEAHRTGVRNYPGPLWCVLMYRAWRESGASTACRSEY